MSNKHKRSDSSDDSEHNESDKKQKTLAIIRHQYVDNWFQEQSHVPIAFNMKEDGFTLNADRNDRSLDVIRHRIRDDRRNQRSRQLWSFTNDCVVTKHCEPWGETAVLCNKFFIIIKKFFAANSKVSHIIIRDTSAPHHEYLLDNAFFSGWSNVVDYDEIHYDYLHQPDITIKSS
jgi:hypothetical protein